MKILHISKYYVPYVGGVETVCKQLVDGAQTKGHSVAVVCFNQGWRDKIDVVDGVKVYRVGAWVNIARQALSPTYFSVLHRALKEFQPDVVHFHAANPYPAWVMLCKLPKSVKLVIHWHMDIVKQAKIYRLIRPIESRMLQRADLICVTSPRYADSSVPLQPFMDKVRVVPNAVDERILEKRLGDDEQIQKLKERYGNKKIVFFVGRHIQYKGLPWLIEAERLIKNECVVVIAGSGPLTEKLKSLCVNRKRIRFVGRLSEDELRWHYYAASVFAFPSITRNEAFGVALAEAMYCGVPVVTFTIEGSGVNWVSLNGKTGIEVPNKDSEAFAAAIDDLLGDEDLAKKMGDAGRERVMENFLLPRMIDRMEECYKLWAD